MSYDPQDPGNTAKPFSTFAISVMLVLGGVLTLFESCAEAIGLL